MSVKVRKFRKGGWEVDINVLLPTGQRFRERRKASITSKSGAQRWGEERERHILVNGPPQRKKEVPTLEEFAPRFIQEYARANRQKPSGIASKETILRVHLIPALGSEKLDSITHAHVQSLKVRMMGRAPKTVNNVLTVLNVLLKTAMKWELIDRLPCAIQLLPIGRREAAFHDFDIYERLLRAAQEIDWRTYLIVLLGGEAGLRVLSSTVGSEAWNSRDLKSRPH